MVYKLEVVEKDNLKKIRYIGDNIVRDQLLSIDIFRDLANYLMSNNPQLTYDHAYMQAKEISGVQQNVDTSSKEIDEGTTNTNSYTKAKVKVYTMNNGIPNMFGDENEVSQQGI